MDCELCGKPIGGVKYRVSIEGVQLVVCRDCYKRVVSGNVRRVELELAKTVKFKPKPRSFKKKASRHAFEDLELVEDYNVKIRRARESLGWSWRVLAQKVGENENVIRRIEAGRLMPTIEIAKKLEKVLKIKLLQPTIDEVSYSSKSLRREVDLTLGDVAFVRRKKTSEE